MKKSIKVTSAISTIITNHFSKDGKEKAAKAAFQGAVQAFMEETQQQINSLNEEKDILLVEMEEAGLKFEPSKAHIMRLQKSVREASQTLENKWLELEELAITSVANEAIAGRKASAHVKQLARVVGRDESLQPINSYVVSLRIAEKTLADAQRDSKVTLLQQQIDAIDAKIVELKKWL